MDQTAEKPSGWGDKIWAVDLPLRPRPPTSSLTHLASRGFGGTAENFRRISRKLPNLEYDHRTWISSKKLEEPNDIKNSKSRRLS